MTRSASSGPAFVAVDWGTSSFRAALVGGDGSVLAEVAGPDGILKVEGGDFAGTLRRQTGAWLSATPGLPVLLSGMIGSRNGWVEVPYAATPADPISLAAGILRQTLDGHPLLFVPGLMHVDAHDVPDVMRGEEVQVLGAGLALPDAEMVLPGTHSKWVTVRDGRITGFRTFMTGELYAALKGHTILGRLAEGDAHHADGFAAGVLRGYATPALSHALFTARTLPLTGRLAPEAVASYLSGLLIGAEFSGALAHAEPTLPHVAIGDARLVDLYRTAAALIGLDLHAGPHHAAVDGLVALARALDILPGAAA